MLAQGVNVWLVITNIWVCQKKRFPNLSQKKNIFFISGQHLKASPQSIKPFLFVFNKQNSFTYKHLNPIGGWRKPKVTGPSWLSLALILATIQRERISKLTFG